MGIRQTCLKYDLEEVCELLSLLSGIKEILGQAREEDDGWLMDVPLVSLIDEKRFRFLSRQCYDECLRERVCFLN